jgi:hypothetical protein
LQSRQQNRIGFPQCQLVAEINSTEIHPDFISAYWLRAEISLQVTPSLLRPEGELSELQGSITALGQYQTIAEYVNPKTLHGVAMCDFFVSLLGNRRI